MPEPGASGLSWSVRGSFLRYLQGLPDGRIDASDGAEVAGAMPSWPLASAQGFSPATGRGVLRFGGRILFTGHFGALDLAIGSPELTIDAHGATIVASSATGSRIPLATAEFAEADAAADHRAWIGRNVRLSGPGSVLFGGVYPAEEPLDPFVVVLSDSAIVDDSDH